MFKHVYVIKHDPNCEESYIVGIFTNADLAYKKMNDLMKCRRSYKYDLSIENWNLNILEDSYLKELSDANKQNN